MEFKLYTNEENFRSYADPARYQINEGILMVWTGTEKITYSPTAWNRIVEAAQDAGGNAYAF